MRLAVDSYVLRAGDRLPFRAEHQTPFRISLPRARSSASSSGSARFLIPILRRRYARYERTYGTVGGVAILLLFFYIDALVLLVGAEINSEIDFEILGVKPGTRDFRRQRNRR